MWISAKRLRQIVDGAIAQDRKDRGYVEKPDMAMEIAAAFRESDGEERVANIARLIGRSAPDEGHWKMIWLVARLMVRDVDLSREVRRMRVVQE